MKKNVIWCALFLLACTSPDDHSEIANQDPVVTDFSFGLSSGDCKNEDYTISFVNESTDADSVLWNFGDASVSRVPNPEKTYSVPGAFNVTLTVFRMGEAVDVSKSISVPDRNAGPIGNITYQRVSQESWEYEFTIDTNAPSYSLQYGNGTVEYGDPSKKKTRHTYSSSGTFKVILYLNNEKNEHVSCYSTIVEIQL